MFEKVEAAPPDAILGLVEAFKADASDRKVNLTVGVYHNEAGTTPILHCVKQAERKMIDSEQTKSYLAIDGHAQYARLVQELMLGKDHPAVTESRVATVQTPGGTGGLRVAADWLAGLLPGASIWLSHPTWPNHPNVFRAAGCAIKTYAYYDSVRHEIDFEQTLADLAHVAAGDVVVLHGCCHNPTGADLSLTQWAELAALLKQRQALPLVDFAYQGFANGLEEDAAGLRTACDHLDELLVCSSFSKNFGLYRERVGALSVVAQTRDHATAVLSQLKRCIRANYSNPPAHGASIVAAVLSDDALKATWIDELAVMRNRINSMRSQLADQITARDCPADFSFMKQQRGMFSLTGLTPDQVATLREEHAIYIVGNGRINLAGLNDQNLDYVAASLAGVFAAADKA